MNIFTEKIVKMQDKIVKTQPSILPYDSVSTIALKKTAAFLPIEQKELIKIIATLKHSTSLLDPIPNKLLKELLPVAMEPIHNIINLSINLGHVPWFFKMAFIKPLIKKPNLDPIELGNYRPMSNLPYLSKIVVKKVVQQK